MYFRHLLDLLIAELNRRIRNGEFTERGLARRARVSQSHIHNVLCGARILTPDMADRILVSLEWTLADVVGEEIPKKGPQGEGVERVQVFWVRTTSK
jgi:hypothetical protein